MATTYYIPKKGATIVSVKPGINIVRTDGPSSGSSKSSKSSSGSSSSTVSSGISIVPVSQKPAETTKQTVAIKKPVVPNYLSLAPKPRTSLGYSGPGYVELAEQAIAAKGERETLVPASRQRGYVEAAREALNQQALRDMEPQISTRSSIFGDPTTVTREQKRIAEVSAKRQSELAAAQKGIERQSIWSSMQAYGASEKRQETTYRLNLISGGAIRDSDYPDLSAETKLKIQRKVESEGLLNVPGQKEMLTGTTDQTKVDEFNAKAARAESEYKKGQTVIRATEAAITKSGMKLEALEAESYDIFGSQVQLGGKAEQSQRKVSDTVKLSTMMNETKDAFRAMGRGELSTVEKGKTVAKAVGIGGLQITSDTVSFFTRSNEEFNQDRKSKGVIAATVLRTIPGYYETKSIYDWDAPYGGRWDLAPMRGAANIATFGYFAGAGSAGTSLTAALTPAKAISRTQKIILGTVAATPAIKLGVKTIMNNDFWGNLAETTSEYSYMAGQVGIASAGFQVGKLTAPKLQLKFSTESKSVTKLSDVDKNYVIEQKGKITSNLKDNLKYDLSAKVRSSDNAMAGKYNLKITDVRGKILKTEAGSLSKTTEVTKLVEGTDTKLTLGRDVYNIKPLNQKARTTIREFNRLEDRSKVVFSEDGGIDSVPLKFRSNVKDVFIQKQSNIQVKETFREYGFKKLKGNEFGLRTISNIDVTNKFGVVEKSVKLGFSSSTESQTMTPFFKLSMGKKGQLALPGPDTFTSDIGTGAAPEVGPEVLRLSTSRTDALTPTAFLWGGSSTPIITPVSITGSLVSSVSMAKVGTAAISKPATSELAISRAFSSAGVMSDFKVGTLSGTMSMVDVGTGVRSETISAPGIIDFPTTPMIPPGVPPTPPPFIEIPELSLFSRGGGTFGSLFGRGRRNKPSRRYVASIQAGQLNIFGKKPKRITGLELRPLLRGKSKW